MKKIFFTLIMLASCCLWGSNLQAQCSSTEDKVVITVRTDNWAQETSWDLVDGNGNTLASDAYSATVDDNTVFSYTVCIPAGACATFTIYDSYGDGLSLSGGYYNVELNGNSLTGGNNYWVGNGGYTSGGVSEATSINGNCAPSGPANDDCTGAEAISCGDVKSGSTSNATSDGAPYCGVSNTAPGVWYTWTGDGSCVILSTGGSSYDTKLTVYSGSCGSFSCVDGDDDGGPGLTSEVNFTSTAGTTYYILVHGFSANTGNYELSMSCASNSGNASCSGATAVTANGASVSGNTASVCGASNSAPYCGTSVTAPGRWHTVVGTGGFMSATTCNPGTNYDTKIHVYSGSCGSLSCVGGNDDMGSSNCSYSSLRSRVQWCSEAGVTYYIMVSGFSSNTGDYELSVSSDAPLAVDAGGCQSRFVGYAPAEADTNWLLASISGGSAPYDVSWSDAGLGVSTDGLGLAVQPGSSTTYTVTVVDANGCTASASVTVNVIDVTCGNGKVAVCHVPPGNPNNPQDICISASAVPTHMGHADDHLGPCSNTCLNTNSSFELAPPSNDECIQAFSVSCGQTVSGSTVGMGNDTPGYCGTSDGTGGGVWYKITGNGQTISATTCNAGTTFDTKLRVFTGSCGNLSCVTGNDDMGFSNCSFSGLRSRVTWSSAVGQTYYILVHGYSSNEGDYEMSVSCGSSAKMGDQASAAESYVKAYPNPFNETATIEFSVAETGNATVEVYSLTGTKVATVFNNEVEAGAIQKVEFNANNLSNGIYIYRLVQSNGDMTHGKIQLVR